MCEASAEQRRNVDDSQRSRGNHKRIQIVYDPFVYRHSGTAVCLCTWLCMRLRRTSLRGWPDLVLERCRAEPSLRFGGNMMPLWLLSVCPVWTVSNACTLTLYCLPRDCSVKAMCLFHGVHEKGSTGDHYIAGALRCPTIACKCLERGRQVARYWGVTE